MDKKRCAPHVAHRIDSSREVVVADWEDNIKMVVREISFEYVEWIGLVEV
jgi:hypothetical protein